MKLPQTLQRAIALGLLAPGVWMSLPGGESADPSTPLSGSEILRRVVQNASRDKENDRLFDERYAYTERRVTTHWNTSGELKKRKTEQRENRPELRWTIDAGRPGGQPRASRTESLKERPYEKDDFPITEELVSRYKVEVREPEVIRERRMLVVDFEPVSPPMPASGLKERFLNRVAGRAWVDATDFTVMRLQIRLTETLNVLAGLVGALHHCEVSMERERTEDGLYYIRELVWRIEGRETFFTRIMDFRGTFEDVRGPYRPPGATPEEPAVGVVTSGSGPGLAPSKDP